MAKYKLTKSTFLRGVNCSKSLWLFEHKPHLLPALTPETKFMYDPGDEGGLLARELFPGGKSAGPATSLNCDLAVELTGKLISEWCPVIYEAAFLYDNVFAALDILVYKDSGWHGYEVKSSTKVHDLHLTDSALQYWIIENCGLKLSSFSVIYINSDFERQGEIDVRKLFKIEPVTYLVQALQDEITDQVAQLKKVVARRTVPNTKIGPQCTSPYTCTFKPHCFASVPKETILDFTLYRKEERFRQYHAGTKQIAQIKDWKNLKTPYNYVVETHIKKGLYLNPDPLKEFIAKFEYPLQFMDFETVSFAIPPLDRSRPYDQMTFQYSLHTIEKEGAEPEHREYLADPSCDFREAFIKSLLDDLGTSGHILVWSIGFERSRLNMLSLLYPQYEIRINAVIERLVDLAIPFQKKWVYDNSLSCSYSIKNVLPCVAPDLSYKDMAVNNGQAASVLFQRIMTEPDRDWSVEREHLLKYCELDTWAMVVIYRYLNTLV
jgi:hypothetical protein